MDYLDRRSFIKYTLAGAGDLSLSAKLSCAASRDPKPNVVLIPAVAHGDVGCHGNTVNKTPHIDALSAERLRFTDLHANGPACSPTRAALLTGRYQQRKGIQMQLGDGHQVP